MVKFKSNILIKKIRLILNSIGLNEKYNAFEYLSIIMLYMLENSDYTIVSYNNIINILMQKFNLTKRSLIQGLNKLLSTCTEPIITNSQIFNLKNCSSYNKIKLIFSYIHNNRNCY